MVMSNFLITANLCKHRAGFNKEVDKVLITDAGWRTGDLG
jgi:hypothetical protein